MINSNLTPVSLPDQLPIAPNAEASLLSAALVDDAGAVMRAALDLRPEDFSVPEYAVIYRVMLEVHRAGLPVDDYTIIADRIAGAGRGAKIKLGGLSAIGGRPDRAALYAREIRAAAERRRKLGITADEISQLINAADDADDFEARYARALGHPKEQAAIMREITRRPECRYPEVLLLWGDRMVQQNRSAPLMPESVFIRAGLSPAAVKRALKTDPILAALVRVRHPRTRKRTDGIADQWGMNPNGVKDGRRVGMMQRCRTVRNYEVPNASAIPAPSRPAAPSFTPSGFLLWSDFLARPEGFAHELFAGRRIDPTEEQKAEPLLAEFPRLALVMGDRGMTREGLVATFAAVERGRTINRWIDAAQHHGLIIERDGALWLAPVDLVQLDAIAKKIATAGATAQRKERVAKNAARSREWFRDRKGKRERAMLRRLEKSWAEEIARQGVVAPVNDLGPLDDDLGAGEFDRDEVMPEPPEWIAEADAYFVIKDGLISAPRTKPIEVAAAAAGR